MKIIDIDTIRVEIGVDRRVGVVTDTKGFRFKSQIIVIVMKTDDGLVGLGEANGSADWSGETHVGEQHIIDHFLTPLLIGGDPRDIRYNMKKIEKVWANPFAKAGLEMAMWDILGKSLNTPLYRLLGGPVRPPRIPLRFAIMPVDIPSAAEVARRMVDEGCQIIKVKVGRDSAELDVARVRAVRLAVGPDVRITVDANGGWTVNEAIRASRSLEEFDVAFVEQPVNRLDLDGMAQVRNQTRLPVMADESIFTVQDAIKCIQKGAADILSVYPGKNGGILNVMSIVSLAEAAGIHCAIGSNLEWDIASLAMAHLAVSLPNITVERYGADIIGPLFHIQHAMVNPIDCSVGFLTVPNRPGLGAELDMHKLNQVRI